jgi:hypothetical protein
MSSEDTAELRCSFCSKSRRDVLKLIAGPTVYICNECVGVCNQILSDEKIPASRTGLPPAKRNCAAAEEHLSAVKTLIAAGELRNAARLTRDAAVTAMRGILELAGADTHGWSEVKVITNVLQNHPGLFHALQETDISHIILRVALDGAAVKQPEAEAALQAVNEILVFLRKQIENAQNA